MAESTAEQGSGWGETFISRFRKSFGGGASEVSGNRDRGGNKKVEINSAIERILAQEKRFKAEQKQRVSVRKGAEDKSAVSGHGVGVMSKQNVEDLLLLTGGGEGVGRERVEKKKTSLDSVREKIEKIRNEERRIGREARKQAKMKGEGGAGKGVGVRAEVMPVIKEGATGEDEDVVVEEVVKGGWGATSGPDDLREHNQFLAAVNHELLHLFKLTSEIMTNASSTSGSGSTKSSEHKNQSSSSGSDIL